MLAIPGRPGRDTCDGVTRRELLRVGGSAAFGIALADVLRLQQQATASESEGGRVGTKPRA